MLTKRIEKELNDQINAEFYSAYLYLSMAAFFESINLKGFANWVYIQFQEEQSHAMLTYNYINERGSSVTLSSIEAPPSKWDGPVHIFEEILKHEQEVTCMINKLISTSMEEKDHASVNFLQWFVSEQVEEESGVSDILQQLKMIDGKGAGLLMLDRELKQRVFVQPAASAT
ncbi:MAG: ferritin [Spirochaetes bacterium]|nr:ferritin [Spirochaetota bacterium]